jgi:putative endonuclease
MMSTKRTLGQRGEQLAATYLQRQGYYIITTNWRCSQGELDIVARKDDTLVFVEVRTRRSATTEEAFESVKPLKQDRLQRLAYTYLSENNLSDIPWRVDVIAVALPLRGQPIIEHVENALEW